MTDMNSQLKCAGCGKTEAEAGKELKRCAKCQETRYCSRECQKDDWKQHKKVCASNASSHASASGATGGAVRPSPSQAQGAQPKNLKVNVDKPFHKLSDKTWLHDRPGEDVFKLLIDAYRLRMEDVYKFTGDVEEDSIYNKAASGEVGFRRFVGKARDKAGLMPSWWTPEKLEECVNSAGPTKWSNLAAAVGKSAISDHYGNPDMPMQLRMFAEQVYGTPPVPGQSGAGMMAMKMRTEAGDVHSSQMDVSSSMFSRR